MEVMKTKTGEVFPSADPPSLFAVGQWNGYLYIIKFGPDDQYYDVKKEADRLRAEWAKQRRIDRRGKK